jgi:Holliday junction resolvase RusA-like endonuclease
VTGNPEIIIDRFIRGVPYARSKSKGRLGAPRVWTSAVVEQTAGLPLIAGPCQLEVEFVLPWDKFPSDLPFGMDLDNLLKRLLDALGTTVLQSAPGGDSAIVSLQARKRPLRQGEEPGARITFRPATFPP